MTKKLNAVRGAIRFVPTYAPNKNLSTPMFNQLKPYAPNFRNPMAPTKQHKIRPMLYSAFEDEKFKNKTESALRIKHTAVAGFMVFASEKILFKTTVLKYHSSKTLTPMPNTNTMVHINVFGNLVLSMLCSS